jgi:glutathione S-transferase
LKILQLPFQYGWVFVFGEPDVVRRHNPLVPIPVLLLEGGTNLVESGAILDEIDHMVSPDRRLPPNDGPLRRRILQIAALALGCADNALRAFYEDCVTPAEKVPHRGSNTTMSVGIRRPKISAPGQFAI